MKNIISLQWNGREALRDLVKQSSYGSAEQAVASLAAFTHPATVQQLRGENAFQIIRGKSNGERGTYASTAEGLRIMLDDNLAPIDAFLWANKLTRAKLTDIQFNHIWSDSRNVDLFTNLANICALPAFLSKLTDTDEVVKSLLRYRAYDLYHSHCSRLPIVPKPAGYDDLNWEGVLPAQEGVQAIMRMAMKTKPKSRTVLSARYLGWVFSKDETNGAYLPDPTV